MLIKRISNVDWDWHEPASRLVSYGRQSMVKEAAWYKKYTPEKNAAYLLTLAMGAGEAYGPNRNGDYFSEQELIDNHDTFVKYGKHYKHHENKNPEKSYGDVVESHYNPRMRRVELIIKVDRTNKDNKDMLEKADAGIPVPVSMAAKVPFDVCSICGNQARTLSAYCEHLKDDMLRIYEDGRQVFALNPNPKFFDISEVVVGADPTAFAFKKVASVYAPITYKPNVDASLKSIQVLQKNIASQKYASYNGEYAQKRAILERLAELEKKIEGLVVDSLGNTLTDEKLPTPPKDKEKLAAYVSSMAKNGIALKVSDLYYNDYHKNSDLLMSREKVASPRHMFRYLLQDPKRDALLESIPLLEKQSNNVLDAFKDSRSLKSEYCEERARNFAHYKSASRKTLDGTQNNCRYSDLIKVATLNLCVIYNNPELLEDPLFCNSLIAQNIVGV